jgi:hypothetical protein
MSRGKHTRLKLAFVSLLAFAVRPAAAQDAGAPESRAAIIEAEQAAKSADLHPFQPNKVEEYLDNVEDTLLNGGVKLHPFFQNAYSGGGFTLGAGYATRVSSYNIVDVRGSVTFKGYTRLEAAFMAPRLFRRRGTLTLIGGWRNATQVGFYGIGTENTSSQNRANYSFTQPYGSAALSVFPTRKLFVLGGALDVATWNVGAGKGSAPSVDDVYTPATLPGLGATPTYVHMQGTLGLDFRPSPGYSRTGGYYAVTFHDFHDTSDLYGFRRTDYEAIQNIPVLHDAWVISLHGRLELANAADNQVVPYFMLPALGGGSSLRGFASWRFRDMNSLLLQADWRVLANHFFDMAVVFDAGRVAAYRSDLTKAPLKNDYGLGFRFHGALTTPLRIEFVRSNEGFGIVFSSKAAF